MDVVKLWNMWETKKQKLEPPEHNYCTRKAYILLNPNFLVLLNLKKINFKDLISFISWFMN